MNILYFLEPSIEQNDIWFRYSTFKSLLVPEIKSLKKSEGNVHVILVAACHIIEKYEKEIGDLYADEVFPVGLKEIESIMGSRHDIPLKMKKGGCNSSEFYSYAEFFEQGVNAHPDIVVTYESIDYHLRSAFPSALHLNAMFGAFSRAPFPSMVSLDFEGIYDESYLYKNMDEVKEVASHVEKPDASIIKDLRVMANKSLSSNVTVKEYVYNLKKCYDSLVLLPLQVDGHLSFLSCVDFASHHEMIEELLREIPENIGVLVTGHSYKKSLTKAQIEALSKAYPNFIYYDNEDELPSASQFFLPYTNGMITVSSSLGYQAALWQKPLMVLGKSQLSVLSTAEGYACFIDQVMRKEQIDRDCVLSFIYNDYNFYYKHDVFAEGKALATYSRFYELHKQGDLYKAYRNSFSYEEKTQRSQSAWRGWLLNKEVSNKKLTPYPDYLRLGFSYNKAVSYDLFDTLAERDFVSPHEAFQLIELKVREYLGNKNFNFNYFRREAEKDVRRPTKGEYEITIDQIYDRFEDLAGLSRKECDHIKKLEVESEVALVHPKRFMIENYHFSRLMVDRVSVLSDIYLEKDVVENILESIGVTHYDLLYSSASEKLRKHNGSIYPKYLNYLESEGVDKKNALHVGDNDHADGKMAKMHGLNVYVKPKAIDNYKKAKIGKVMQASISNGTLSTSILNGLIANKFYGLSYNANEAKTLFQGSKYQFGYSALGPLVYGFSQKLLRRVKQAGYTDVYFLARDGWLLKESFDLISESSNIGCKTHYLYASRRAAMVAAIRGWEDIREIASQNFNAQDVKGFLSARFGLDWDDEVERIAAKNNYKESDIVSPYAEQSKLFNFLSSLQEKLLSNSKKERESYVNYLEESGLVDASENGKPLLVDIGYSGSMQYYFKKILGLDVLDGFYLLTHHHSRNLFINDLFEGYLSDTDDHKAPYRHKLNDFVFLFESCLSSPEGSFIKFTGKDANRKMDLLGADDEVGRIALLRSVHRGAKDFVYELVSRFGSFVPYIEFSPAIAERIIINFFKHPNGIDASIFKGVEVENVFGGGSVYLIPNAPVNFSIKEEVENFVLVSKWKEGAKAWLSYMSESEERASSSYLESTPSLAGEDKKGFKVHKDIRNRKRAKLKNNPYMYFYDIRAGSPARLIRYVFDSRYLYGRACSKLAKVAFK